MNNRDTYNQWMAVVWFLLACLLGGCIVTPKPLSKQAHSLRAMEDRKLFQADGEPVKQQITLAQAMARAVKYNLDHNLKIMEEALALGQTQLSKQEMLPKLSVQAGYVSRNKRSGASSVSMVSGAQSLEASSSSEKDTMEADLTVTWNVLDFGLSYIRAHQQADRYLVAGERRRKVVHNIIQEVRQAFWRAMAAQQLMPGITLFLADAKQALIDSRRSENQQLQSPINALEYQMGLLETIYQITTLQRDLTVAKTQLAALLNLDLNTKFTLSIPSNQKRSIPTLSYDSETLENMALVFRPELREESYLKRIDASETRLALLQLLPGLGFSSGYHYSSNSFLYYQNWAQSGLQMAWNLVNLINAPTILDVAEAREKTAMVRRLSMGMAVLTQVHVARLRYNQTREEYLLLSQMSDTAERIRSHTEDAGDLRAKTGLEQIQTQARAIYRRLQKELAYAELQNAAGRLYLSIGADPLPETLESHDLETLSTIFEKVLQRWNSGEIELGQPPFKELLAKTENVSQ